jgi:alpha-tubulin suppressor-like RCC1 family protein
LAVTKDGKLYYWGNLGIEDSVDGLEPTLAGGLLENVNVVQAGAGIEFVVALGGNGRVYSWGTNFAGQVTVTLFKC